MPDTETDAAPEAPAPVVDVPEPAPEPPPAARKLPPMPEIFRARGKKPRLVF